MDFLTGLRKNSLLNKVSILTKKKKCHVYLVGGFLRDLFLKRQSLDLDFAVDKNAIGLARFIGRKLGGDFVILDKEHGSARIIIKHEGLSYTLDFTDFRGKDIKEDLFRRDFTVNALGIDISLLKKTKNIKDILLDPYSGKPDIIKKTIRVINNKTFDDDPLRILRVFSMSAVLSFKIDKKTIDLVKRKKKKLTAVSFERIREELFKILSISKAAEFFKTMDEVFVLDKIMPQINIMRGIQQGPYHHLDVLEHSFETLVQLEKLFLELKRNKKIVSYLSEIVGAGHSRRQVLKLAAFLHDIGKPDALVVEKGRTRFHGHEHIGRRFASGICDRLKLSQKEKRKIKMMILWHLRPGYLADNKDISDRAIFRYFRDTQDEGVSVLLLSIADQRATRGPLTNDESRIQHEKSCRWLAREYFKRKEEKKLPNLITGHDLIKKLKLIPGPLFGNILETVKEEQAAGVIRSKKEALQLARKIAKGKPGKNKK